MEFSINRWNMLSLKKWSRVAPQAQLTIQFEYVNGTVSQIRPRKIYNNLSVLLLILASVVAVSQPRFELDFNLCNPQKFG